MIGWRFSVVVACVVRRMNEVDQRWARLVLGWVTVSDELNKPTRSTQPCISPGSLNRVPALIGWGKGRNVTSARCQVTLCDPIIWHVSSRSGEACCELILYFTYYMHNWLPMENTRLRTDLIHYFDSSRICCRISATNRNSGVSRVLFIWTQVGLFESCSAHALSIPWPARAKPWSI